MIFDSKKYLLVAQIIKVGMESDRCMREEEKEKKCLENKTLGLCYC